MWNFDDIFDPMSRLQRAQLQALGQPGTRQEPPRIPPLTPQEEQSLLPRIGNAALGGLGYVGGTLEKAFGGRAIRGALGGRPRELLSVLPFSDTLGITDEAERVGGRDLLRQWGLADDEDTWGNFGGGLGLDILTDPGTYLTFGSGALSQAGQVAKKIGQVPKGATGRLSGSLRQILATQPELQAAAETAAGGAQKLAPLMDQSLGGLFGWKIPFTNVGGTFLEGQAGLNAINTAKQAGQAVASAHNYLSNLPAGLGWAYQFAGPGAVAPLARGVGKAWDWTGRHLGALFDSSAMGATTHAGQEAARDAFGRILPYAAAARDKAFKYGQELAELGVKDTDEFRMVLEGLATHPNARVNEIAAAMRQDYATALQEAERLGLNLKAYAEPYIDTFEYGHRQWSPPAKLKGGYGDPLAALHAVDPRLQTPRESVLEGFKEGTVGINRMVVDPAVHQGNTLQSAAHIAQNYLIDPAAWVQQQVAAGKIAPADAARELAQMQQHVRAKAARLAQWVAGLPEEYKLSALGQIPEKLSFFGHHPVADYISYFDRFARMRASGEAAQNLLARNVLDPALAQVPKGARPLDDVLAKAGLVSPPPLANPAPGQPVFGGAYGNVLEMVNNARQTQGLAPLADLAGVHVPEEVAGEIARYMTSFRNPEAVNPFVRGFDWLTGLFKSHVTAPWPGFHVRNLLSGQFTNLARGADDALGMVPDAYKIMQGQAVPWAHELPVFAGQNLTPEQATRQIASWMASYGVGGHMPHITREVVGPGGAALTLPHSLDDVLARVPGHRPKDLGTVWDVLSGGREGTSWNPKHFADVAGVNAATDVFTPVAAGRELGDVVEGVNRGAMYLSLLKQGYTAEEAGRQVLKAHFDYTKNALTPFEKTVMRRLMPFYSFTRQNLPSQIEQLATNPGGLAGQTARLAFAARNQPGEFIPKHLGESLAIPVGGETPEGSKRFLTRLDLPPEQAFEFFKGTMGDPVQDTLMGLLGQLNPVAKGPLEYAANKQFFSGRELGDLYSLTGNYLLDQAIFNSPAARYATTARTLADPRKWESPWAIPLNLLTGAKVTDVDMPKYRSIAEREYIKERLQGLPAVGKFETLAIKPELLHTLTPAELELVRLQRLLEQRGREQRKVRVER